MSFNLSPEAASDIRQIVAYIRRHDPAAAIKLRQQLFEACERLGKHPAIGHRRRDLTARDLRFWPVRHWLIAHHGKDPVEIVTVVDARQNLVNLLR